MSRTARPLSERKSTRAGGKSLWSIDKRRQYEQDMLVVLGDKRTCSCGKPALEGRWFCSEECLSAIQVIVASAFARKYRNLGVDISSFVYKTRYRKNMYK